MKKKDTGPQPTGQPPEDRPRRPWRPPKIEDLPPLTDLTLQTGSPIGGDQSIF
jgi:hypothetical protein